MADTGETRAEVGEEELPPVGEELGEEGLPPLTAEDYEKEEKAEEKVEEKAEEKAEEKKQVEMTSSEKKATKTKEKLIELREKIAENPPKTVWGKRRMVAKLERLEAKLDRQLARVEAENASQLSQNEAYEEYDSAVADKEQEISDLLVMQEDIAERIDAKENKILSIDQQIKRLERYDPNAEDSIFNDINAKREKNKPKGYKPRPGTPKRETIEGKTSVVEQIEKLKAQREKIKKEKERLIEEYEGVRESIEIAREDIGQLEGDYKVKLEGIQQQEKENLALTKTNPIKSFFAGIQNKFKEWGQKFSEWNQRRKQEAESRLTDAMAQSEGVTRLEISLREELASNRSLEEQRAYAEEVQAKFDAKRKGPEEVEKPEGELETEAKEEDREPGDE